MNDFLVYYAYYHNNLYANENTLNYVSNTNVQIAKVRAENYQEAEDACIDDLNLENTGYIINTVKL